MITKLKKYIIYIQYHFRENSGVKTQQKQNCLDVITNKVQKTAVVTAKIVAFVSIKIISECSESFMFNTGLLENLFLIRGYGDDHLQTESCKEGSLNCFWNDRYNVHIWKPAQSISEVF